MCVLSYAREWETCVNLRVNNCINKNIYLLTQTKLKLILIFSYLSYSELNLTIMPYDYPFNFPINHLKVVWNRLPSHENKYTQTQHSENVDRHSFVMERIKYLLFFRFRSALFFWK